jgi:hypothetical protein
MSKARLNYLELSRRPIYCLLFIAPFLIGYEIGVLFDKRTLLAERMLRDFLTLFGRKFNFLSGLFVLAVLIGWQIGSRQPWTVRPKVLGLMLAESAVLTLPLFLLHAVIPRNLSAPPPRPAAAAWVAPAEPAPGRSLCAAEAARLAAEPAPAQGERFGRRLIREIVISLGAGPYEELIFRLFLVELLLWLMIKGVRTEERTAVVVAVLVSATLFAGYHYLPETGEPFTWGSFLFRTGAGIYFSLIFVARGYGIAAGCHTFYDILVDVARAW